jgi:hypothetical protein
MTHDHGLDEKSSVGVAVANASGCRGARFRGRFAAGASGKTGAVHRTIVMLALLAGLVLAAPAGAAERYRNPLTATIPGSADRVETFADPHVLRAQDGTYYAYGTTDPLNDRDRDAAGELRFHRIPTLRSTDLVNWTSVGDAFSEAPAWMEPGAPQWAPDVRYLGGRYGPGGHVAEFDYVRVSRPAR